MPIRGVLLFAFFIVSLPACFVWPFYGVVLWTIIAFLNPQSALFYWSAAVSFPWALAVAIPTLVGFVLFTRGWTRRLASREFFFILVLWAWFTVTSFLSSSNPLFEHHAKETWYRWGFVSKVLLMTILTMAIVDSFSRLRTLVLVIAGCFGYFVLKAVPFIVLTGGAFRIYGPEFSMIADNNDFGLALNMTLPLFFLLARTEEKRWVRWLFGYLFVAAIPAIFFTYSRGALVGLLAVGGVMLLQLRQRVILISVIAVGVLIVMLFAPPTWKNRMDPTRPGAMDASARERLNAWAFARNLAAEFPIEGGGFSTFTPQLFSRYAPQGNDFHGSHSVYFQVLGEHGYVGLVAYLALVISCLASLRKTMRVGKDLEDEKIVQYAQMLQLSIIGFLASGMFLGRAYFDYFYSVVACVVILKRISTDRWQSGSTSAEDPIFEFEPERPLPQLGA
jgi:probable O-glycosylation ligase (exosortase A-associated)